jgi:DNA (cytosine-5)-methyltransferase 1
MKEMSGCSIHPNTRDEWVASMQASLVLILAALEIKPESAKAREADFIEKCSELLTLFDHDTCIWRTSQRSFLTNSLEPFSETWPRAGMMRDGRVYRHRQPVPRTTVIGGGALQNVPTPTVNGNYNRKGASQNSGDGLATYVKMWPTPVADDACNRKEGKWNSRGEPKLSAQVKMWPTPSATDYKGSVTQSLVMERLEHPRGVRLPEELVRRGETGGQLNPDWTEWLMGFPIGHTASKLSATPKSRSKPRLRGNS